MLYVAYGSNMNRCLMARRCPKARPLGASRWDLDRSPGSGEGYGKVWARLRVIAGIRVRRSRVPRIMGENSPLSPHRRPPRPANDHGGSIATEAPNVTWGADGAVIPTVEDGNVTLFIVAVSSVFGSVRADAARGVSSRHDHVNAFMSDSFHNQLKVVGMAPSFAFVRQPETNGVAARDLRTLKERIVFGRISQDAEEVGAAVRASFAGSNQH